MSLYRSKPSVIEAVQWNGINYAAVQKFAGSKVTIETVTNRLMLHAGKDGAQEWVPVPVDHWLVCQPDDKSDIWPVDPDYFDAKYEATRS